MSKQEFQGKTLDEALSAAAKAFGTDVTQLSYNILPQSSGGLFAKLFQKGVRLEAWVDSSQDIQAAAREAVRQAMTGGQDSSRPTPRSPGYNDRPKQTSASRTQEQKNVPQRSRDENRGDRSARGNNPRADSRPRREEPRSDRTKVTDEESAERSNRPRFPMNSEQSKGLLIELAEKFTLGFDSGAVPSPQIEFLKEDEVLVNVSSASLEELLVKSDRLSCAFEHLFKRIAQKRFGDISGRVVLNAGTASERREEKLRDMALDAAARVRENGKTITLSSKSSQERRVIHLALENMEGIATKSVGMGENRKLIVFSTLRPPREPRDQNRRPRHERNQGDETQRSASSNEKGPQPRRSRRRGRHGGQRQPRRSELQGSGERESTQSQNEHNSFEAPRNPEASS